MTTKVSVIIPCRNEGSYIGKCLDGILAQDYPHDSIEILIADGRSTDDTVDVVRSYQQRSSGIRLLDNPEKIVSTALNTGIRAASGSVIIRMDAHTEYAPDYISECVRLLDEKGCENVGGPWTAAGKTYLQTAIAAAFQSPFSCGGARSHSQDFEGVVDSVYLGCWKKKTLEALGLFDEELVRNQDDELNLRIVRSGGRIWQSPSIRSTYYPRGAVAGVFRQYRQYGYWKVRVIQKHRLPASLRHLVPGAFVASVAVTGIASIFSILAAGVLAALIGSYFVALIGASVVTSSRSGGWKYLPAFPVAFAAFHLGYGLGFLQGVIDFLILRKQGRQSLAELTR